MDKNIISFEEKRKKFLAKPYIESEILRGDFSGLLNDIRFFKNNVGLVQASDHVFRFSMRKNKNYFKSVKIQKKFVDDFKER